MKITKSFKFEKKMDNKLKQIATEMGIPETVLIRNIVKEFIENDFEGYEGIKHVRGHKVLVNFGDKDYPVEEVYADTKEPFDDSRPCTRCGEYPSSEGTDACLGQLPGVTAACCGHGVEGGYIQFENGKVIRFEELYIDSD